MKRQVPRESFRLYKTVDSNRHTSQEFSCSLHSYQLALFHHHGILGEQHGDGEVMTAMRSGVHEEPVRSDNEFEGGDV